MTHLVLLSENPLNWALLAVLAYIAKSYAQSSQPAKLEAKHPPVLLFKNYTPVDLLPFDGLNKEHDNQGPYANFAGHDASRGLAKHSFDKEMVCDPYGPIDRLEDLNADEWDALREWEQHFATKYLLPHTCALNRLPDELLLQILKHLAVQDLLKLTGICRKWYHLVYEGSLWQTIDSQPFYKTIPGDQLMKMGVAAGPFLKVANFRGCVQLTGYMLRALSDYCHHVEDLNLQDCRGLSTASLARFLSRATRMRSLNLSGLESVKDTTLHIIGQSQPLLTRLNVSWCRNITGRGIQALLDMVAAVLSASTPLPGRGCCRLQVLKMNGCALVNQHTLMTLAIFLPDLQQLSLAACSDRPLHTLWLDKSAASLYTSLHTAFDSLLTHINLSNCTRLSNAALQQLVDYCPAITHLELAGCTYLSDEAYMHLAPRLPALTHLDIEGNVSITNQTVRALANHTVHLQHVCLSNCVLINDEAVLYLVLHGQCRHVLQSLELGFTAITDHCLDTIASVLVDQHQQQKQSLASAFSSSDATLMPPIAFHRPHLTLEVLDCAHVTEAGVRKALAKAAPFLTIKNFYSWRDEQRQLQSSPSEPTPRWHSPTPRPRHHTRSPQNCIIL
ncbi:RNI-like protein [Hesseltinella vesiculosa]|uniref:RNI-like protein n=1 Tax=Hesseltinella vesiculosa TaxID=101127 RepID=A0A1X2G4U8_9FUNG|nr:RNI-like protein [Hesseltinella vesiculosa]